MDLKKIQTADGFVVCYQTINLQSKNKTLVLLHGATGSTSAFKWLVAGIKKKTDLGLIYPDLRGHGLSDRVRRSTELTHEKHAFDLKAVLEKEKIKKIFLAGHCFGTQVAITFAGIYPKCVEKLILISPAIRIPKISNPILLKLLFTLAHLGGKILPYSNKKSQLDYSRFKPTTDLYLPRVLVDIKKTTLKGVLLQFAAFALWKPKQYLDKIDMPTLIIVGKKDTIHSLKEAEFVKSKIKKVKIIYLENANHVLVINNPEEVAELIVDFISI